MSCSVDSGDAAVTQLRNVFLSTDSFDSDSRDWGFDLLLKIISNQVIVNYTILSNLLISNIPGRIRRVGPV